MNVDINSTSILDRKIRSDDANTYSTLHITAVSNHIKCQLMFLHIDIAAIRHTFTVHKHIANIVSHVKKMTASLSPKHKIFAERIISCLIPLPLYLPAIALCCRGSSNLCNLTLCLSRMLLHTALPIFFERNILKICSCRRFRQSFGDHRFALEIRLTCHRSFVIELASESIQHLIDLIFISRRDILAIRRNGNR